MSGIRQTELQRPEPDASILKLPLPYLPPPALLTQRSKCVIHRVHVYDIQAELGVLGAIEAACMCPISEAAPTLSTTWRPPPGPWQSRAGRQAGLLSDYRATLSSEVFVQCLLFLLRRSRSSAAFVFDRCETVYFLLAKLTDSHVPHFSQGEAAETRDC